MKFLTTSFVFEKWHVLGNKNAVYSKLRRFIFWHCFPAIRVQLCNME